ncbi:hypothetical protein RJZ56_003273 [Blastomyces dermatitidis]
MGLQRYLGSPDPMFPFHWECFCRLAWALNYETESNNLDRTVLYEVMKEFSQVYAFLELDYGQLEGPEQDWYSVPGDDLLAREMEWLWEMNDILDDDGGEDSDGEADNDDNEDSGGKGSGIPDDLSLKRLYLYLYEKTTPTLRHGRRIYESWKSTMHLATVPAAC